MTNLEEAATLSFQIIAAVGEARSLYIEAIHAARKGEDARADELLAAGDEAFARGHALHGGLAQREAAGEAAEVCLMLVHAEDQLMSAESFGILAREFIPVLERLGALECAIKN